MNEFKRKHDLAVESVIHGQSFPGQFNRMFPGARNGITSYYPGMAGEPELRSTAGLHGRYVVQMTCEIKLDSARTNIVSIGSPSFYLYEFTGATFKPNGKIIIDAHQMAMFGADEWQHLVEAKGDLKALNIFKLLNLAPKTNRPVENFERILREADINALRNM